MKKPKTESKDIRSPMPPATTPEGRERQLIGLAYDLVEQRLRDGTATSQETCHFLKLATTRERLEIERLRTENELSKAKTESIKSQKRMDEIYENAIRVFRTYSGHQSYEDDYSEY